MASDSINAKIKQNRINAIGMDSFAHHIGGGHHMSGKDEAKFRKMLYTRDVNIMIDSSWSPIRARLAAIVVSTSFETIMGIIILFQFCFAIREIDYSAHDEEIPGWLIMTMDIFLSLYGIELALRFYVLRLKFFESKTNLLDFFVIMCDVAMRITERFVGTLPSATVFRIFRLLRLLRALRVLTTFRELYIMLHSFIGAMKAIFWATMMIFVVLTLWSMLAVEFLHPLNRDIAHSGCSRCPRAYESVMQANLTFFQQIVAGDSWGQITIPMIEQHPWTLVIYIPAYISIGLGMVNLVLTVIVDRADQAKIANEQEKLHLKLVAVKAIFSQMDEDCSGCVSLEEFTKGLAETPEMQHALDLLGIRVEDISTVFQMMDYDGSGTVSCDEFVENLAKLKNEESFMILLYVKHFMNTMEKSIDDHVQGIKNDIDRLTIDFDKLSNADRGNVTVRSIRSAFDDLNCSGSALAGVPTDDKISPSLKYRTYPDGFELLKQDMEVLCRSTEENLAGMLRTVTQKLDEHVDHQKQSLEALVSVRQLLSVPDRAQSNSRTTKSSSWAIMCGDVSKGSRAPQDILSQPKTTSQPDAVAINFAENCH